MLNNYLEDIQIIKKGIKIARVNYKNLPIHFLLITLTILTISLLSAFIPLVLKKIVDSADASQLFAHPLSYLLALAILYGLMWTANEASDWIKGAFTSFFLASIESSLYKFFTNKLFRTKYQYQEKIDNGTFVAEVDRAGSSVGQVIYIIFWSMIPVLVQFLVAFAVIAKSVSIGLSIFINVFLIASFFVALKLASQTQKIYPLIFSARNMMMSHAVDKLSFLFEIKTNNTYKHELNILADVSETFVSKIFKANLLSAKLMLIQVVFIGSLLIISNIYLVIKISGSELTAGDFVLISGYIIQLSAPIIMLSQLLIQLKGDVIAISDVYKYLDLPEDRGMDNTLKADFTKSVYSMNNLKIGATGKLVTLDIKEGYWYSIIGESGSGKSTFIKLLLNLADTQFDHFEFGGYSMSAINCEFVLSQVAVVNQKPLLFKGSLLDNLNYGNLLLPARNTLISMLNTLNLTNFIPFLNTGSTDWLNQASGGELQRLSILRAYLRRKPVVILDEPTASLDEKNALAVIGFIKENFTTVIIITHDNKALRYTDYLMDLSAVQPSFNRYLS